MLRNITLSAEALLIDRARARATSENRTLNSAFREWLAGYSARESQAREYDALMKRLSHIRLGGKFTREEMNERR